MDREETQTGNKTGYQCGSCERVFHEDVNKNVRECRFCGSGNFVRGFIDGGEIPALAEKEICVNCGDQTRDIPRFDYTIEDNRENGWKFPEGGYICDECEADSYAQDHLEGSEYCPSHGFVESYFNRKDEAGNFIGCYDGCQAAADYDREVRDKYAVG